MRQNMMERNNIRANITRPPIAPPAITPTFCPLAAATGVGDWVRRIVVTTFSVVVKTGTVTGTV